MGLTRAYFQEQLQRLRITRSCPSELHSSGPNSARCPGIVRFEHFPSEQGTARRERRPHTATHNSSCDWHCKAERPEGCHLPVGRSAQISSTSPISIVSRNTLRRVSCRTPRLSTERSSFAGEFYSFPSEAANQICDLSPPNSRIPLPWALRTISRNTSVCDIIKRSTIRSKHSDGG